jgi:hypothetical protein
MRKDAALSGEVDRIPQLSWLLFLKAFDALEAQISGKLPGLILLTCSDNAEHTCTHS